MNGATAVVNETFEKDGFEKDFVKIENDDHLAEMNPYSELDFGDGKSGYLSDWKP